MVLIPPGFRDGLIYFNSRDLISAFDIDVVPTDGDEVIAGHILDDVLFGLGGNDRIVGNGGDDIIFGDEGRDTLSGNAGDDLLSGGDGDDRVRGHGGNDSIDGGAGNDILQGYRGRDEFQGGAGNDLIDGGSGKDTAHYLNNLINPDGSVNYSIDFTTPGNGSITDLVGDEGTDTLRSVEHLKFSDVKVKLTENNAPFAQTDTAFVESGDFAAQDVLVNDVDIDGMIDRSTIAIETPAALGTASANAVSGNVDYVAPDIGGDTVDDSVVDTYQYTVADDDGAVSAPTNVSVMVIDPLVETDTDDVVTGNDQTLMLSLSTEDRTFNTSSFVDVDLDATDLTEQFVNVSFVLDGSNSLDDTAFAEQVQAVRNTISALRADFAGSVADVEVQLVEFSDNATSFGIFDLNDPSLDAAVDTLAMMQSEGLTNYEAALQEVQSFLNAPSQLGQENFIFFASDGEPNAGGDFTNEAAALQAIAQITAVGFGVGIDTATLDMIDNTGGSEVVMTAAELGNAFATSPLFLADLVDFSLTISTNGGLTEMEIATEADLISSGGGNFTFSDTIMGLLNDLGDETLITATAAYDTDGDPATLGDQETLIASTIINGTDGSDILAFI